MSSPTGLVDAADFPLARVNGVIWAVLVNSANRKSFEPSEHFRLDPKPT